MALEFWYGGKFIGHCVLFMKLPTGIWLRFFFDAGVFFWREVACPDRNYDEGSVSYRSTEIPDGARLLGQVVDRIEISGIDGHPFRELVIAFAGGSRIRYEDRDDKTQFAIELVSIN